MSEGGNKTRLLALIVSVFGVLTKIWGAIPQKSRERLITAIADGFEGILRRFFRKFHAVEVEPGQQVTT